MIKHIKTNTIEQGMKLKTSIKNKENVHFNFKYFTKASTALPFVISNML